jgi:uncharacterized lipoprotein YmbA
MTEQPPESALSEELRRLGHNLKHAAEAAWESPEGQQLRGEIKAGLRALESGLQQAAAEVTTGETGQRLKAEVEDFSARVKSGQVETQLRHDLLTALRTINSHLDQAAQSRRGAGPGDAGQQT